jgi:hypothetical protein
VRIQHALVILAGVGRALVGVVQQAGVGSLFRGGRIPRAIDPIHAISVADETRELIGAGERTPALKRLELVSGVADLDAAVAQRPADLATTDATSNNDPVRLFRITGHATDVTAGQAAVDRERPFIVELQKFGVRRIAGWTLKNETAIRQGPNSVSTRA